MVQALGEGREVELGPHRGQVGVEDASIGELAQQLVGHTVRAQVGADAHHPADLAAELGEHLRGLEGEEPANTVTDQLVAVHVEGEQLLGVHPGPIANQ